MPEPPNMRIKYSYVSYLIITALLWFTTLKSFSQQTTAYILHGQEQQVKADEDLTDLLYFNAIIKIDSIKKTRGVGRHFSVVFSSSLKNINNQVRGKDPRSATFIKKFISSFVHYFTESCEDHEKGSLSPASAWKNYFDHPDAHSWQLMVAGVNAHINMDMWRSLVDNFGEEEIRRNKKLFLSIQKSLDEPYRLFFDTLLSSNSYMRFMNSFTKGMSFEFGRLVLQKWRKRQVRLAILYYHDQRKFKSFHAMIQRKKLKTDEIILRVRKN
jgi:hypothetical protein